jgi:hypothetical protein
LIGEGGKEEEDKRKGRVLDVQLSLINFHLIQIVKDHSCSGVGMAIQRISIFAPQQLPFQIC